MENKEIILKLDSIEFKGNITTEDIIVMFSAGLKQVCDMLENNFGNKDEGVIYGLGIFIHSIIEGKTDKEIAKIFTQTELIRREYKKFMENEYRRIKKYVK